MAFVVADNQRWGATRLNDIGVHHLIDISDHEGFVRAIVRLINDEKELEAMAQNCLNLIDGRGRSMSVTKSLKCEAIGGGSVRLMTLSDIELVLSWRNHPDIRKWMRSKHVISRSEHVNWFNRLLENP